MQFLPLCSTITVLLDEPYILQFFIENLGHLVLTLSELILDFREHGLLENSHRIVGGFRSDSRSVDRVDLLELDSLSPYMCLNQPLFFQRLEVYPNAC